MLTHFYLTHYQLTLEALDQLELPPFKGSALRGGFGHTFKRLVCFQSQICGQQCALGNACPYGYIFETAPPADSTVLRTLSEVPRPFLIEPPPDQETRFPPGERLTFGLTLIGQGSNYLPYFVLVFRELGRVGLGRGRGQYQLRAIEAVHPYQQTRLPVYRAEDELIQAPEAPLRGQAIQDYAASLPAERLTLTFLTPTRLKHRGRWVRQGPPFAVLVKALLGRLSSLSYFHCGHPLEVDFRGLIAQAAEIEIAACETAWTDWSRYSGRQQQRIHMGGLTGTVTYAGDLGQYLPLLAAGALIHVGKGTVFGNGQYRLEMESGE